MNIRCLIQNARVEVYRGERLVATVDDRNHTGDPVMTIYGDIDGVLRFTFNDLEIIKDNWNQLEETYKKSLTCPKNAVR